MGEPSLVTSPIERPLMEGKIAVHVNRDVTKVQRLEKREGGRLKEI